MRALARPVAPSRLLALAIALALIFVASVMASGLWVLLPVPPLPPGTGIAGHTATLLSDGTILVAGGESMPIAPMSPALTAASLYQPTQNGWFGLPAMATDRAFHGAELLPGGTKVLVAGGYSGTTAGLLFNLGPYCGLGGPFGFPGSSTGLGTAAAEIFDESAFGWTPAASMNSSRAEFTLVRLANGMVLAPTGDFGGATAELFNPVANTWSYTAGMNVQRLGAATTLLPDGRVFVAGGDFANVLVAINCGADAEVYDPIGNTWSLAGGMSKNRYHATASVVEVADGSKRVLVAGGEDGNDGNLPVLSSAELWNPATNIFSPAATMNSPHAYHTATRLPNGQILVTGGLSSPAVATNAAEIYDPVADSWLPVEGMILPRAEHTATLELDTTFPKVVVVGGSVAGPTAQSSTLNTAELFQPTPIPSQTEVLGTQVFPGTLALSSCQPGLNAFVSSPSGFGIPTGSVFFQVDGGPLVSQPLMNGRTQLSTPLAVGSHSVQAFYTGDGNFSGSASTVLMQQSIAPPIQISGPSTATKGSPVTLFASVPAGATSPFHFMWMPPNGTGVTLCNIATAGCFAGIPPSVGPNVFTVTGTDANSCQLAPASFTVNVLVGGVDLVIKVTSLFRVFKLFGGSQISAVISIANYGSDPAGSVSVTASSLNGVPTLTSLPLPDGTLTPGANSTITLDYPGGAALQGASVPLRLTVTFTDLTTGVGGGNSATFRVTGPG